MYLLDGKISPLFLSYFIYNHGLLSFLLKQGKHPLPLCAPTQIPELFFGKKLALKEKQHPYFCVLSSKKKWS